MNGFPRIALWLLIAAALGAAPGCGPGKITVTGQVTRGGTALVSKTGHVQVKLIPVEAGEHYTTYPGIADENGKFEILGVPPGKYKVAVELRDSPTSDGLGGWFNDQNTKIRLIRDVDSKPLIIDLNKLEG